MSPFTLAGSRRPTATAEPWHLYRLTTLGAGDDITVYGNGSQTRSFCYIDDMIDALMLLMRSDKAVGMPVNLGNPNELTVRALVDHVLAMTSSGSRIVRRPLPVDDPRRRKPDIRRATELLGWQPTIDLEPGLEATIAWFAQDRSDDTTVLARTPLVVAAE